MKTGVFAAFFLILTALLCSSSAAAADIRISPESVYQGRTFSVTITGENLSSAQAGFLGKEIPFYSAEGRLHTIIGVSASAPSGQHPVKITVADMSGNTEDHTAYIYVRPYKFQAEKLLFPPQKKGKLTAEKIYGDQQTLEEVLRTWTGERFWQSSFILPLKGKVTSPFGAYRLYNEKRLGDHRGVDIGGNPAGTPIKATNSGVVAFAKPLPAYGSTVVIDHGQGVHSIYMHLSKTLVKAGQFIDKGTVLGRVGSTGISTGPHLHWGISIHDTRVDPISWINSAKRY